MFLPVLSVSLSVCLSVFTYMHRPHHFTLLIVNSCDCQLLFQMNIYEYVCLSVCLCVHCTSMSCEHKNSRTSWVKATCANKLARFWPSKRFSTCFLWYPIVSDPLPCVHGIGSSQVDLAKSDDQSATPTNTAMPQSMVIQRVHRDFVGLEQAEKSSKTAMMDFSFYLTLGDMDEAFKAIKVIKRFWFWLQPFDSHSIMVMISGFPLTQSSSRLRQWQWHLFHTCDQQQLKW